MRDINAFGVICFSWFFYGKVLFKLAIAKVGWDAGNRCLCMLALTRVRSLPASMLPITLDHIINNEPRAPTCQALQFVLSLQPGSLR